MAGTSKSTRKAVKEAAEGGLKQVFAGIKKPIKEKTKWRKSQLAAFYRVITEKLGIEVKGMVNLI